MKIPYGISDFKSLRKESYLYVDKTNYISSLEGIGSKYLFFIRPRRFGKSLFLSTLANYYDLNNKEEFDELFESLYIGKNPTELKTSYLILKFNFSGLNTDSKEKLYLSFKETIRQAVIASLSKYRALFINYQDIVNKLEELEDVKSILNFYIEKVKDAGQKVYLIIDEYDHFANDIIAMGDSDFYKEVIRATGFVRDFYETVKIGTESVIDRVFITGISPVMLDDLTSGFNIASNITMNKLFNEMLGFTEKEVKGIIEELNIDLNKEELLSELRKNYNGYLFNKDSRERVYNPDMILHFFSQWLMTGDYPDQLIDDNVRTDYGRLNRLVANEANREVLEDIIIEEGIVADIITRFSFDMMYDEDYFVSLLFYMGLLTIDKQYRTRLLLKIPNFVVKTIFWEYIEKKISEEYQINLDLNELRKSIEEMAYEGEIEPYIDYINNHVFKAFSNRDLINYDERYIKVILFAYLVDSKAYKPYSETEVENGYIDIYLERDIRMPDVKYEWIIELKYLKKSERDKLAEVKQEGLKQLERYAASRKFEDKDNIKQALLIFIGKDEYELII
ncbi:AAA family ATPase [Iocasia frigidifontis]|uniref:AAA family ATPase n=1 Tax=Iocasia fonsfrigidae TaxID=2682810 RepID=A0A8A7KE70_9FIRM|nr:AAA family ATPase [Iocasia fonsfrigidae]QTL99711.1 AAA family ATPase [Iocasia fonsfrigidae]